MKKYLLLLLMILPLFLAGCIYQKEVCETKEYSCKVIAVENTYEQISKFEDDMTFWLQKRWKTTREIIADCWEYWRKRSTDNVHIVWDTYSLQEKVNCRMIDRDSETDRPAVK